MPKRKKVDVVDDDPEEEVQSKSQKLEEEVINADEYVASDAEADADFADLDLGDENGVPEMGIIEEITLKNFMCHSHLSMKFGQNVNFIVGPNGSNNNHYIFNHDKVEKVLF